MIHKNLIIGKIAIALSVVVFLYLFINWIFSKKVAYNACDYLKMSAISSRDMTFITVASLFIGYFFGEFPDYSKSFLLFGLTAPPLGIINILINRPKARKFMAGIPILGNYMTCPLATDEKVQEVRQTMRANGIDDSEIEIIQKCTLSCEHCRAMDAVKIIGSWSFTRVFIPWIFKTLKILG